MRALLPLLIGVAFAAPGSAVGGLSRTAREAVGRLSPIGKPSNTQGRRESVLGDATLYRGMSREDFETLFPPIKKMSEFSNGRMAVFFYLVRGDAGVRDAVIRICFWRRPDGGWTVRDVAEWYDVPDDFVDCLE